MTLLVKTFFFKTVLEVIIHRGKILELPILTAYSIHKMESLNLLQTN